MSQKNRLSHLDQIDFEPDGYVVLDSYIVDTNSGVGGALRIVINLEDEDGGKGMTRTVFLDLGDLFEVGLEGYYPKRIPYGFDLKDTRKKVISLKPKKAKPEWK
jgi:hypothetical protein